MKIIKTYFLSIAFLLLICSANVFAGDFSRLNVIGFSPDGKYLAFEEYGTQDGSGFPYSSIYFIETAKNSFAAQPVKVYLESETATEATARLKAKTSASANLKKFKIVSGNVGELVVSRLITDLSANGFDNAGDDKNQTIRFTDERMSHYYVDEFELALKTSEVKTKPCADYLDQPGLKFDLTLKNLRAENAAPKILQSDKTLPESRNCPFNYSIQNVYTFKNTIAVFMNVFTAGFEGPDMRFMAVTGVYR